MKLPLNWHYIDGKWKHIVSYFDTEIRKVQTYVDGVAQIKEK